MCKLKNQEILEIFNRGKDRFKPGHRTCAGCLIPTIIRTVLGTIKEDVIVVNATGCMEVTTTLWPHSSWNVPYIHNAFANASATADGIAGVYRSFVKKGIIKKDVKIFFMMLLINYYYIGLQSLSGMLDRGSNIMYVLYDNEGYQNTGDQKSGSTPRGADTTTTPAGVKIKGKLTQKKDIMKIVAGHHIKYLAQTNPAYLDDFIMKIKKASSYNTPTFLNVLMPCNFGWRFPTNSAVDVAKLATETNSWLLYEFENNKWKLNYKPKTPKRVEEYLKIQGRFKHLFSPKKNIKLLRQIQEDVDNRFKDVENRTKW